MKAPRKSKGLRVGEAAKALGLGVDAVRRLADAGTLRTVRSRGGQRLVDARSVAALAASRRRAGPSRSAASRVSPRNRFAGIVTSVVKDRLVARVEMRAGPHRIVAMVTREAADELGLRPGVEAVASVKAFHVHLEVPDAGGRG
jgi:molybdopterin-binding protein